MIAATTSQTPVLSGEWLRPGTFVAAVGANKPTMREVDTHKGARPPGDRQPADCLDQAGDLVIPMAEGVIRREQVAEIAEVVNGARPARQSDEEITFYKSIGVPIQDLVTAQHIVRRAAQLGIGTEIEIGGDSD